MLTAQSSNNANTKPAHAVHLGAGSTTQKDQVTAVKWTSNAVQTNTTWTTDAGMTDTAITITLNGSLAVAVAATALFATFVLSGITFTLVNPGGAGTTSFNFTYTGTESAAYIQSLLTVGSNITFG